MTGRDLMCSGNILPTHADIFIPILFLVYGLRFCLHLSVYFLQRFVLRRQSVSNYRLEQAQSCLVGIFLCALMSLLGGGTLCDPSYSARRELVSYYFIAYFLVILAFFVRQWQKDAWSEHVRTWALALCILCLFLVAFESFVFALPLLAPAIIIWWPRRRKKNKIDTAAAG